MVAARDFLIAAMIGLMWMPAALAEEAASDAPKPIAAEATATNETDAVATAADVETSAGTSSDAPGSSTPETTAPGNASAQAVEVPPELALPKSSFQWTVGRGSAKELKSLKNLVTDFQALPAPEAIDGKQKRALRKAGAPCRKKFSDTCVAAAREIVAAELWVTLHFSGRRRNGNLMVVWQEPSLEPISITMPRRDATREAVLSGVRAQRDAQYEVLAQARKDAQERAAKAAEEARLAAEAAAKAAEEAAEWEVNPEDSVSLHAEGLAMELGGDIDEAMGYLRQASTVDEQDRVIAFDRARVAFENQLVDPEPDYLPFLGFTPSNADERLLRAYVLRALGRNDEAEDQLSEVLGEEPENEEALGLKQSITPAKSERRRAPMFRAQLRTSTAYDTNVTVLPLDQASFDEGIRQSIDGWVVWTPLDGDWRLDVIGTIQYATHLNNRANLGTYDLGVGSVRARLAHQGEDWTLSGQVFGERVHLNGFVSNFSQEAGALLEARRNLRHSSFGLFARGAIREFTFQNAEGADNDRDGPTARVVGFYDWRVGGWWFGLQGGAQGELAEGDLQYELGSVARFSVMRRLDPITIQLSVDHEYRDYISSDIEVVDEVTMDVTREPLRQDHRVTPSVSASWAIDGTFSVFTSYAYFRSFSTVDFSYERHLVQVGLGATW